MLLQFSTLLAIFSTISAHDPTTQPPKLPWWCRFKASSRFCQTSNNPNPICCPTRGIWGAWKAKTECSDTCGGFGTQILERSCLTEQNCGPCSGANQKNDVKCNPTPCNFPRNSCAPGMKASAKGSQILCFDPTEVVETVPKASCCPAGGIMEFTDWSSCNGAKCGSCTMSTRKRACRTTEYGCPCSEKETEESKPCQTSPCTFPQKSCCSTYKAKPNGKQILCM